MIRRLALVTSALCGLSSAQTFTKDIAPILYEHCAPCHRPGESGPFSLLSYKDAKQHARQIAEVTKARFMPPWKPEHGKGDFQGERLLTDLQIRQIQSWADQRAPEGDPKDLPPLPRFIEGWQLGKPDLVLTLPQAYVLAAGGGDVFRNFILRVPLDRTRYVRAVEIRPGNKKVVHHANLLIDRGGSLRARDGQDGSPGFPGMDVRIESHRYEPDSHFLFWKPGTAVSEEPEGMAWRIEPGTDLVLNVHLQPGGKPEEIQPSIGLYFTETAPVKIPILVQLENDGALAIPPGDPNFEVTDTLVLPVDADVLAIYPHAHYIGKDIQAYATLPDGSRRWLIHIRDWDMNWQAVYRYRSPVFLPKGTVIGMRYVYDNSPDNPRNPNRPPVRVVNGDRSVDEMAHLWLQLLSRGSAADSRALLEEAVLRRRLEKYPSDFFAHFSLGALMQTKGSLEEAIGQYQLALAAVPHDATAHNALGTARLEMGNLRDAAAAFQAALREKPEFADAHYNLARLLLANDRPADAITHLRQVIRVQPQDASALSDLGAALQIVGQTVEGLRYLREAVRLQPNHFNARYNLGQALAAGGALAEAESELREALRIKPNDADALDALRRLKR